MHRLRRLIAAAGLALAVPAQAGIIFTPHLSEYARIAPGSYDEFSLLVSRIDEVYDRDGQRSDLGTPLVPPGESADLAQLVARRLWVGNPLRDTGLDWLEGREQFCRLIVGLGWQQASTGVADRSHNFGLNAGGSGLNDVFALCGMFGRDHRLGPLRFNGLFSAGVKVPVGRYERDSLLNTGTDYWTGLPQVALHAELYGRLYLDATFAWQFNAQSHNGAYGGLSPSRPADVRNLEANLAWKFSERWFADLGYSHRQSVGANRYDDVSLATQRPVSADIACQTLRLGPGACAATSLFLLEAQPGRYRDDGVEAGILTAGISYVYRSSSVWSLRALLPIEGRSGQIDVPFDLYLAVPDLQRPGRFNRGPLPIGTTTTRLNGVQEAASVSASPALELRLVYLFWAP